MPNGTLSTVAMATRVLEYIAHQPRGVSLTQIMEELNLAKASAHRVLKTWVALEYLEQDERARYRLGWKLFELMARRDEELDLRNEAHPFLRSVSEETGETVHFSVLDNYEVVYVDKIEGRQPIRVYTAIGRRGPVHATASGKAMLAHQDEAFLNSLFDYGLEQFTDLTITGRAQLQTECRRVQEAGFAVNRGEWHEEVAGVGVPLFDHAGRVTSALSVTFPSVYLDDARVDSLADTLMSAGRACSQRLGNVSSTTGH